MRQPRLAYIVSRFPHLTETFILRELVQLREDGWEVLLYPLIVQKPQVVQTAAAEWTGRARRVPFLSWQVVAANARMVLERPGTYLRTLAAAISGNLASPRFLVRALLLWPKAVFVAEDMRRAGVEHVHAHYATHTALVAWTIRRLTGTPYSVTVHAHDIFVDQTMLAAKLREATFIVAISDFNRQHLAETLGPWVLDKTVVLRCGVPAAKRRDRTPGTCPDGPFEIASVGSLQPYKGFHHLLRACALLKAQGITFRCRIAGAGEERRRLEAGIAALGLHGHVELLGACTQEEVFALLASVHCYVQPSIVAANGKMEGIPVALMEAMTMRLPVVATALSGIPELVRDGDTGYLVPPGNEVALSNAIARVIRDSVGAAAMASRGQEAVTRDYDLAANVARLEETFLERGGRRACELEAAPDRAAAILPPWGPHS